MILQSSACDAQLPAAICHAALVTLVLRHADHAVQVVCRHGHIARLSITHGSCNNMSAQVHVLFEGPFLAAGADRC